MDFSGAYPLHPANVAKATRNQFSLDVTGGTDTSVPKNYVDLWEDFDLRELDQVVIDLIHTIREGFPKCEDDD